jgi:hypothetical protein
MRTKKLEKANFLVPPVFDDRTDDHLIAEDTLFIPQAPGIKLKDRKAVDEYASRHIYSPRARPSPTQQG